jgi:hypothetical protein
VVVSLKSGEQFKSPIILGEVFEGDSVQGIGVGRLHVSQTGAEPTIAEMELRKGGEYQWNSWVCGYGLLSTTALEERDYRRLLRRKDRLNALGNQ